MKDEHLKNSEANDSSSRFDKANLEDQEVQDLHNQVKREKGEPSEGKAPLPMLVFFGCMLLCLWVGFYFNMASPGGMRWDVFDPNEKVSGGVSAEKVYDPIASGKKVFNNCVACHQASGAGIPGVYPPLAGSDWVGKSPEILTRIVLHGLSGEIVVNGETYNNAMTAFSNLSDKKIAAVLSYVRNSWGNQYPIITEEEVAAIRANAGSRSSPYTAGELLEMFPE